MNDGDGAPIPPTDETWTIRITDRAGIVVIAVAGELDYATTPSLRTAITEALSRLGTGPLVLDLTEVTFLGSGGLTTLIETAAAAEQQLTTTGPLRIVVDQARPVIRPLEITGLDQLLRLYHDVEDAAADHRKPAPGDRRSAASG